jgi:hypothetical protein
MNKKSFSFELLLFIISFLVLANNQTYGQISNMVSTVRVGDAKEKNPLSISAELFGSENISAMNIAYKFFGQNEYKKMEMLVAGNTASVTIPAEEVLPPYVEYYLIIGLKSGSTETYPLDVDKGVNPLQVAVSAISEKDKQIIVLSPTAGEMISQEEMLISISFVRAPDNIDVSKTKIYINDQDLTSSAMIAGDLIVLSGENVAVGIGTGARLLKVDVYDKDGKLYHSVTRSFQAVSAEVAASVSSRWKYNGFIKGESRNENYNSTATWYNNLSAEMNSTYDQWRFNGFAYLTSEEKSDRQPYNRYTASIQGGDWLDLKVGDAFPRFPNIILDGQRVRGVTGSINLGTVNLQATYGETVREVEGSFQRDANGNVLYYNANNVPLGTNIIKINSKYGYPYAAVNLGTYNQKLLAIRPSFGSGENFQLGFTYMHAKDEPSSIEFGARPQENLVLGTDLMFAFDEQNIMFTSQAAFSLLNKDISTGTLSNTQIDSLFGGSNSGFDVDPKTVKDVKDILGSMITVNQYLGPWNPQELSSLAAEAALSLNYFNNTLRASYIYRGNDYQSFGQTYLNTDKKGINIVDRIRMLDNKVFLSIGYENLEDNLQKTKITTTTYQTLSTSISIFPRIDFPNITIGYNRYAYNNGLNVADMVKGLYAIDDITNRVMVQLSYDFFAIAKHNSSLSFTTSTREDNGYSNIDTKFSTAGLNVSSFWTSQLSSDFGLVYSTSEIAGVPFNYFTITASGRYRMLENKLLLSATLSPSFGDFQRQAFEVSANYNVLANLNLIFQARVFSMSGVTNSIIGLSTRLAI